MRLLGQQVSWSPYNVMHTPIRNGMRLYRSPLRVSRNDEIRGGNLCRGFCFRLSMGMGNDSIVRWHIPPVNFDNVGQGFLSLMQVSGHRFSLLIPIAAFSGCA